jgi:putative phosphoesterase
MIVGLISDTHGLLRNEVHEALAGVDLILHAGDVCSDTILDELRLMAPVQAVYGNCDDPWDPALTQALELTLGGLRVHVSHGHELGRPKPAALAAAYPNADVIIYGHTHQQIVAQVGTTLVVNPGAAGPRRFSLSASCARLTIVDGVATAQLIDLPG